MVRRTHKENNLVARVREIIDTEDYSIDAIETLHANYHSIPIQFKEIVIDHFGKALLDYGAGPTYNKIKRLRESLLPKSRTESKVSQKSAEIASRLLAREFFISVGERQKTIYHYNKDTGIWTQDGRSHIQQWIQKNIEKSEINSYLVNEVVAHIERETRESIAIFNDDNREPHVVLENCVLYLDTLLTETFRPELHALNKLPVLYDPNAECPNFKRFIGETLSIEDLSGVQEELGAILRRKYLTKKFSIYIGAPDTGKTTLISVVSKLLGDENVSKVSIQDLASRNPFQTAPLYGKLANIRDDLSKEIIYSAGKLKEITGGFPIQAERKFQEQFNFTNSAYLIFTCNDLPPLQEDDEGFFARVIIRNFANKFGGHDKPDRNLLEKITTKEELSGILNWAIEGYHRLRENGWNFTNTVTLDSTREDYKLKSDPVWAFCQDWIDEESQAFEIKEVLYNTFKQYCKLKDIPLITKDKFFKTLPTKVNVSSDYRTIEGQGRKHAFVGIKLNSAFHLSGEKTAHLEQTDQQRTLDQGDHSVQPFSNLSDRRDSENLDVICEEILFIAYSERKINVNKIPDLWHNLTYPNVNEIRSKAIQLATMDNPYIRFENDNCEWIRERWDS